MFACKYVRMCCVRVYLCVCSCVCVCVCARTCVCVCLLSLYFLSPEVVNAQAKVSGEHGVFFITIATEAEIREKCKL